MTSTRPFLKLTPYTWKAKDGTETPGVALKHGAQIKAHLDPAEARKMADRLHDYADKYDTEHPEKD